MAWKHNVKQRKELKSDILPAIRLQKDYKRLEGKTMDFIIKAIKSPWGESRCLFKKMVFIFFFGTELNELEQWFSNFIMQ